MLRRIAVLALLAAVAAMFAGVSSAQATSGVCVFTGLSGALNPGIQNIEPDLAGSLVPDVERGSYSFHSGGLAAATCAGEFAGTPVPPTTASITSAGFYDNVYCGTGFAHDLDGSGTTISAGALSIGGTADPAGYEIPFVAGVGPLLIGPDGKPALAGATDLLPPDPFAPDHPDDGDPPPTLPTSDPGRHGDVVSNYIGTGLVQITPGNPALSQNCVNSAGGATTQFTVAGFLVGTKYQSGADGELP